MVIDRLTIGAGEAKIVANSKALHHVLPQLVPPIDRQYTLRFFFNNLMFAPADQHRKFATVYTRFHEIGATCRDQIDRALADPEADAKMNTSFTKVIDNAIIGYCQRGLRRPH